MSLRYLNQPPLGIYIYVKHDPGVNRTHYIRSVSCARSRWAMSGGGGGEAHWGDWLQIAKIRVFYKNVWTYFRLWVCKKARTSPLQRHCLQVLGNTLTSQYKQQNYFVINWQRITNVNKHFDLGWITRVVQPGPYSEWLQPHATPWFTS